MSTFGLIPEVVRADRDATIELLPANVKASKLSDFIPFPDSLITSTTPFDHGSISMLAPVNEVSNCK